MLAELPILILDFIDASGSLGSMQIRMKSGTTAAAAQAAAAVLRAHLAPLSGAVIVQESIRFSFVASPNPTPSGATLMPHMGAFIFNCADADTYAMLAIPAFKSEYVETTGAGAGVLIDQTNSDVSNAITTIIDSIACNPFGSDIVSIAATYLQWR